MTVEMRALYASMAATKRDDPEQYNRHIATNNRSVRSLGLFDTDEVTDRLTKAATDIKAFHTARLVSQEAESAWKQTRDSQEFTSPAKERAKRDFEEARSTMAGTRSRAVTSARYATEVCSVGTDLLYEALRVHDDVDATQAGRTATRDRYRETMETLAAENIFPAQSFGRR